MYTKKCRHCEVMFSTDNSSKIYCSRDCLQKYHYKKRMKQRKKIKHSCENCKKTFYSYKNKTKFCSFHCSGESKNRKGLGVSAPCKECGSMFDKKHSRHFYCSALCKNRHASKNGKRTRLECAQCGDVFYRVRPRENESGNNFCSLECVGLYSTERGNEYRMCDVCGDEFYVRKSMGNKFCSVKCQNVWQSETRVGRNHHAYIERIDKKCKNCGKTFHVLPSEKDTSFYCSRKCVLDSMSKTMTKPHRETVSILKKLRLWHRNEYEVPKSRFISDCFLGKKMIIEVQGSYWHVDPRKYEGKSKLEKRFIKRDKRKKEFFEKNDYKVLYIWEMDINSNPQLCEKLIEMFFNTRGILENFHSMNYNIDKGILSLKKDIIRPYFEI